MRPLLLLIALLFLGTTPTKATSVNNTEHHLKESRRSILKPVNFVENGIQFFVYPDGSINFNIPRSSYTVGRRTAQMVYIPHDSSPYSSLNPYRRGYIKYNKLGQVNAIGNTPLYYDRYKRIQQIGNIVIHYKRGRLNRIGNMKVHYDRSGNIFKTTGIIDKRLQKNNNRSRRKN